MPHHRDHADNGGGSAALFCASLAIVADAVAMATAASDGGRGWAFNFRLVGLASLAGIVFSVVAVTMAGVGLWRDGRSAKSWLSIALAVVAATFALWLINQSLAALASV